MNEYDFSCIDKSVDKFFNTKIGKLLTSKIGRILQLFCALGLGVYSYVMNKISLYYHHSSEILWLVGGTLVFAMLIYPISIKSEK